VSIRALRSSDPIDGGSGAPLVVVPELGSPEVLAATLRQIVAHTAGQVAMLVACADARVGELASLAVEGDLALLGTGEAIGLEAALRTVHDRAPNADVVLVREGVLVGPGWLDGLRDAATSDSIVMTASALSLPPMAAGELDAEATAVRAASARLRPAIAGANEDCCYIRAAALQLVGVTGSEPTVLAALCDRLSALGLVHVLADDVVVSGGAAIDSPDHEAGPLRRALAVAQTAVRPLGVTVDARALGSAATGTRTYILDLIAALAREDSMTLRVVLPPDTAPDVLTLLEADESIELITYEQAATSEVPLTDVVHRPQQVFSADDLTLLRRLGQRIVVTHLDLIAYRCAAYHESFEHWRDYRRVTRLTLAHADMVVFPSRHARADALREDLVSPERAHAVPIGTERLWPQPRTVGQRPEAIPEGTELLVCIGADYAHKNRPFALALVRSLHERHGWNGRLVLAGPHVERGSSLELERAALETDPALAELVIDIGFVDAAARSWLYEHAQAIVYPSVYEGFGYLPFEAADAGLPCLYAPVGALGELAGAELAPLVPWDPDASADAAAPLLRAGVERERQVQSLRDAAREITWERCVPQLRRVYEQAVASPLRASAPRVAEDLEREDFIVALSATADHDRARAAELARANDDAQRANDEAQRATQEAQQALYALRDSVGVFRVSAEGGLMTQAQHRALLRIVTRPLLRKLLLAPFAIGADAAAARDPGSPPPSG